MPILGVVGGGMALGAVGSWLGAKEQADAAAQASEATAKQAAEAQMIAGAGANSANWLIDNAVPGIQDNLSSAYLGSQEAYGQGFGQGRTDLLESSNLATGAIAQGQGGALSSLYSGADQGVGYLSGAQSGVDSAINSGLAKSSDLLMGRENRAGAMLDQGLYKGFETDPGYQFRLKQGEEAINRRFAASGGRHGGAALKALTEFNSGLASQEFGNFANRRAQEFGAASSSDAQGLQARGQLAGMYGQGASQMANAQQSFGSQAASMAYGAGQGAAGIQGQGAQSLADIYSRTGTQLGSFATGAGSAFAGADQAYYGGLSDLDWKSAVSQGNNILGASGVATQMVPTLAAANGAGVPYAGAGWSALGSLGSTAATLGMMYAGQNSGGTAHGAGAVTDPSAGLRVPMPGVP